MNNFFLCENVLLKIICNLDNSEIYLSYKEKESIVKQMKNIISVACKRR